MTHNSQSDHHVVAQWSHVDGRRKIREEPIWETLLQGNINNEGGAQRPLPWVVFIVKNYNNLFVKSDQTRTRAILKLLCFSGSLNWDPLISMPRHSGSPGRTLGARFCNFFEFNFFIYYFPTEVSGFPHEFDNDILGIFYEVWFYCQIQNHWVNFFDMEMNLLP